MEPVLCVRHFFSSRLRKVKNSQNVIYEPFGSIRFDSKADIYILTSIVGTFQVHLLFLWNCTSIRCVFDVVELEAIMVFFGLSFDMA